MHSQTAMAEIFVTAFHSLPKREKITILDELVSDAEKEFTKEELDKLERLAQKKGKIFNDSKSFLAALSKI